MWTKNFKIFANHLLRNKLYTFITIFGFAVSLSVIILLSFYIKNELTVNSSQKNRASIYGLASEEESAFAPPVGEWLQSKFPEIESFTRTYNTGGIIANKKDIKLKFNYLLADSTFFNIFTFHLISGNKDNALKTSHSIVLTRALARKLFGNEPPLGKRVMIDTQVPCTVTGIVDDISKTSGFKKVDAIINFRCLKDIWESKTILSSYDNCSFGLYFLAKPKTNLPAIAPKVLKLFKKDFWLYQNGRTKEVKFIPLTEIHFSKIGFEAFRQNSKTLIFVLFAIVIIILFLAIINYINLTIAQAGLRVKEIAVKKLLGSSKPKLIVQQVGETVVVCMMAFFLAVFLSFLLQPAFNALFVTRLNLSGELNATVVVIALSAIVLIGLISGIIPAFIVTKLNAIEVIKGAFRRKNKRIYSSILISFQYVVVIALLISTAFIARQTRFMQNFDPGFNTKNILWMNNNIEPGQENGLRNQLLAIPGVKRVSFVAGSPIDGGNNNSFTYKNKPVSFQTFVVDSSFFPMMQMKTTPTGVAYSKKGVWLNRAAIRELGLDSLPKSFLYYKNKLPVLGVVNDFNYRSLREKPGPIVIRQIDTSSYPWSILVQVQGTNLVSTVDRIRKTYSHFTGGLPFDYGFFDQTIKKWYEGEKRTSSIVGYFALLAIVISIMGIYAMSIFYSQQKTKEIGIRKVNGATVSEIVSMLNKDFVKWVVVAFVIACPIAYYAMHRWLQNFAYKTSLSWCIFVLAGMTVLLIALLTVSWQTFRAARKNPVEALRYE